MSNNLNPLVSDLNEQLLAARRRENQLFDYISALERRLTYARTLDILEAKKDVWSWASARADYNRRLGRLIDPN